MKTIMLSSKFLIHYHTDSFFLSNASLFVVFIGFSLERLSKRTSQVNGSSVGALQNPFGDCGVYSQRFAGVDSLFCMMRPLY